VSQSLRTSAALLSSVVDARLVAQTRPRTTNLSGPLIGAFLTHRLKCFARIHHHSSYGEEKVSLKLIHYQIVLRVEVGPGHVSNLFSSRLNICSEILAEEGV
jgi:hypothetical protein